MKEYAAVFEKTSTGWSAYVPNLPGLGVAGPTYHIEGLIEDGETVPEPTTRVARLPISA